MKRDCFRKDFDSALTAFRVLRRLGCGRTDSFDERLRSQKAQYFAQHFGVSPSYSFNLYLRGPYSPDLASDLFEMKNSGIESRSFEFVSTELEDRFKKLEKFIRNKSNRELEITSTLHWLLKTAKYTLQDAKVKLAELKGAEVNEIGKALKDIQVL